jgi:hypothetical protein
VQALDAAIAADDGRSFDRLVSSTPAASRQHGRGPTVRPGLVRRSVTALLPRAICWSARKPSRQCLALFAIARLRPRRAPYARARSGRRIRRRQARQTNRLLSVFRVPKPIRCSTFAQMSTPNRSRSFAVF